MRPARPAIFLIPRVSGSPKPHYIREVYTQTDDHESSEEGENRIDRSRQSFLYCVYQRSSREGRLMTDISGSTVFDVKSSRITWSLMYGGGGHGEHVVGVDRGRRCGAVVAWNILESTIIDPNCRGSNPRGCYFSRNKNWFFYKRI